MLHLLYHARLTTTKHPYQMLCVEEWTSLLAMYICGFFSLLLSKVNSRSLFCFPSRKYEVNMCRRSLSSDLLSLYIFNFQEYNPFDYDQMMNFLSFRGY